MGSFQELAASRCAGPALPGPTEANIVGRVNSQLQTVLRWPGLAEPYSVIGRDTIQRLATVYSAINPSMGSWLFITTARAG